jgi:hypothetical protein
MLRNPKTANASHFVNTKPLGNEWRSGLWHEVTLAFPSFYWPLSAIIIGVL